jgi:tRNA-Thr(GGU) m(6)t(6)A37 methyltransferase TsaA
MEIHLSSIGFVRGGRVAAEDDDWGSVQAEILLDASRFAPDALQGLADFSHAEIIYHFHQVPDSDIVAGARHPRGRSDWPAVGIFAQRGRTRPNRLGVSTCEIIGVSGLALKVRGLDAIDGTPVLDIKPVLSGFAPRGPLREPAWARAIMQTYW